MENINQKLKELYENKINEFRSLDLSSPLLIKFADDRALCEADLRIMFFGQETFGWSYSENIDEVSDTYMGFFNDFNEYPIIPKYVTHCWQTQKKSSVFWRVLLEMKNAIAARLPDKRVSYIWNNLVKADYADGKVPQAIYAAFCDTNRNLIIGEMDVIKPDVIVFFTGPRYDAKIDDIFNNSKGFEKKAVEVEGNGNALAIAPLPKYGDAYITYHPRYLATIPKIKDVVLNVIVERCVEITR